MREMVRSFLAIAAGFLLIAILTAIATAISRRLLRDSTTGREGPSRASMVLDLVVSVIFGAAGGVVTAFLAPSRPLVHALLLALAVLVISALAAFELRHTHSAFYQAAVLALTPMATLGGGILEVLYH